MRIFLRGFFTLFPMSITVAVVWWLIVNTEYVLKSFLLLFVSEKYYIPGAGLLTAVILTFMVGLAMGKRPVRRYFKFIEALLATLPIVRSVYQSFKDILSFLKSQTNQKDSSVVLIDMGEDLGQLIGLLTHKNPESFLGEGAQGAVLVYIPMSYQIGGFRLLVAQSRVQPLVVKTQEAMRFVFTAGVCATPADTLKSQV